MRKQNALVSVVEGEEKTISLEALEYLGYSALDGIYVRYGRHEGELMPVEDSDTGREATFCCLYLPDTEIALIIAQRFEDAVDTVAALDRD